MTKDELEKEAEEFLQKKWGTSKMLILGGDAREVLADFAEPREKRIAELEKENAELKGIKDVATLIRANNDTVVTLMQLNNMLVSKSQQLTKAKELLLELYDCIPSSMADYCRKTLQKVALFFKDSEVEK